MESNINKKAYLQIGAARLINAKVLLDDKEVYEGAIENAPEEIKSLKYSRINMQNGPTFYAYKEFN